MKATKIDSLKQCVAAKFRKMEQSIMPPHISVERNISSLLLQSNEIIDNANKEFSNLDELNRSCALRMNEFLEINKPLVSQTVYLAEITQSLQTQMEKFHLDLKTMNTGVKDLSQKVGVNSQKQLFMIDEVDLFKKTSVGLAEEIANLKIHVNYLDDDIRHLLGSSSSLETASGSSSHQPKPPTR